MNNFGFFFAAWNKTVDEKKKGKTEMAKQCDAEKPPLPLVHTQHNINSNTLRL